MYGREAGRAITLPRFPFAPSRSHSATSQLVHNPSSSSNHPDHAGMERHCLRADWKGRRADAHDAARDGVSNSPPEVKRIINKGDIHDFVILDSRYGRSESGDDASIQNGESQLHGT
jgi:hypothetical protein